MSDETIELDTRKLDKFLKALKGDIPTAKVGIIGDKNQRSNEVMGEGNAAIGAKHEYGSDGMPMRSFLRIPISDNMQKYLDNSGAFTKDALNKVINEASLFEWLQKIAVIGETIVLDAFDSGGFGKWKPSIMTHKKTKQTLVETQQLRNSISSEVK